LQEKASLVEEGDIEALGVFNGYDRDNENPFAHKLALYTTHGQSSASNGVMHTRIGCMLSITDDVAASSIRRRPFIHDFAAEDTYRLIKSWLDSCVFHHPGCNSPVISELPTRVIDVGVPCGRQEPLLFTPPPGYKDSYIALSYCWGSADAKFVLTKDKARLPRLQFPFATLPKTLQDAVTITKKLGFRFLWIDALCIIQEGDGGEDFLQESARMSDVYGNTTLTIAAAAATNVHEGIFQKPTAEDHPEIKIPYDLPDGTIGNAFVEFEGVDKGGSRIDEPLNTRCWTFQERILSPRVVIFYKDQLSWDCTSTLINSNGPLNPLLHQNQDSPGRYSDYTASLTLSADAGTSDKAKYMSYWQKLIEFYSRRSLTNQNDKLKAVAGLAKLVKSKTDDVYLAGLWRSNLRAQLFWYPEYTSAKRQLEFRAPTWSWASIDGQVTFHKSAIIDLKHPSQHEDSEEVEMELDPKADEFGEVLRARLRIRGHLKCWDPRLFAEEAQDIVTRSSLQFVGIFIDDSSDDRDFFSTSSNSLYFCFFIAYQSNQLRWDIIVKEVETTYRRIGIYRGLARHEGYLQYYEYHKWHQELNQWASIKAETITIE